MAKISARDKFSLHPQLAADTIAVHELKVCSLRLMNDCRFSWLVMVPRLVGAIELFDLDEAAQLSILREISLVSQSLKELTACDKINIAAFGNMVPQLHIHVIARHKDDVAWPGSAIGIDGAIPYDQGGETKFTTEFIDLIARAT